MISPKIRKLLKKLPIAFTKNQKYDRLTQQIIRKYCTISSNCIDVGSHEGDFLDSFLKYAPSGNHFAFEPIPKLYQSLVKKYTEYPQCIISPVALSNTQGMIPFNYVISNPAYSGIIKRKYDRELEKDTWITVQADQLDNMIPIHIKIHIIKIDVEGGEMNVLEGAERILKKHHPLVIFEFGIGGSDLYGITPEIMFMFFNRIGYQLSLLKDFLRGWSTLSREQFAHEFYSRNNYYFIAHPMHR